MANNSTAISGLQQKTYADPTDQVVAWSSVSNADVIIPVANLFSNTSLSVANLVISTPKTPANSTASFIQGSFFYDSNAIYIAISNNNIRRITYKTWSGFDGPPESIGGSYSANSITSVYPPASYIRQRGWVGDSSLQANSTNYGANVVGGGTYVVPVWCDGISWRIG